MRKNISCVNSVKSKTSCVEKLTYELVNITLNWKTVCLPKREGGLGLRDLQTWNKALNLRLIWLHFNTNGSLWVACNVEHRLKRRNFWRAEERSSDSWIWRALLALRPLGKQLIGCEIGDGLKASFWYDNWLPHGPLIDFIGADGPAKFGLPIDSTVSDASSDLMGWRLPSVRTRNPKLRILRDTLISKETPLLARGSDSYAWGPDGSRSAVYSIKATWELLRPSASLVSWGQVIWSKYAVPSHTFNFWVCQLDRLPLRMRLHSWGLTVPQSCCLCNSQQETRDHLLLLCDFSVQVWRLVLNRFSTPRLLIRNWIELLGWIQSHSRGYSNILKGIAAQATVYFLWNERNGKLHNGSSLLPSAIFKKIDRSVRDTLLARLKCKRCQGLISQWLTSS